MFRVIDFLFEHRLEDFTKTDIAKGAEVSWASLFNHWDELEKHKIVKVTRKIGRVKLYQLNESEPIVKELKTYENEKKEKKEEKKKKKKKTIKA